MGLRSFTWETMIKLPIRAWASIVRWASRCRELESERRNLEILACDERMLADIGLSRSQVLGALNQPFWRDPTKALAVQAREREAAQDRVQKSSGYSQRVPARPDHEPRDASRYVSRARVRANDQNAMRLAHSKEE